MLTPSPNPQNKDYLKGIDEAVGAIGPPVEFNYEERDVLLYNLGIGSKANELKYVKYASPTFSHTKPTATNTLLQRGR